MFETMLGQNQSLIGADAAAFARDVATPALCIERQPFDRNLRSMQAAASAAGVGLRPHMKGNKSSRVAQAQLAAGALGLCCATAKEVEVAAASGAKDILLTTPLVSPMVLARLAEIAAGGIRVTIAVDTEEAVSRIATAGRSRNVEMGVLIDLDAGQNRTGVGAAEKALTLARHVQASPGVALRGVQAYYGHLQHVATLDDRARRVAAQWSRISAIVSALRDAGHTIDIVTGGGTGTAELDLASGLFTEIQPGSYPFMDSQYLDIERRAISLEPSLTVLARVTSDAVDGQVIIDAGTKAIATDPAKFRIATPSLAGATHKFMGDEHSALMFVVDQPRPRVGDLVSLVATHCDPTVNLYQRFHVMDEGRLVDIWPIEARGY